METHTLNCPNCGAPLHTTPGQTLAICLYCGSSIRLLQDESQAIQPEKESELTTEELTQVRNLIGEGKIDEAVGYYQKAALVDAGEAASAISNLRRELSIDIILSQQLSPAGKGLVAGAAILLVFSLGALWQGWLPRWAALLLAIAALIQIYPYLRAVRTEWCMRHAHKAPARILKYAPIGRFHYMVTFRVWIEVIPLNKPAFQTEMNLAVREKGLERLSEGAMIEVLYDPSLPNIVAYNGPYVKK